MSPKGDGSGEIFRNSEITRIFSGKKKRLSPSHAWPFEGVPEPRNSPTFLDGIGVLAKDEHLGMAP
jgi:hypothetical protein